MKTEKMLEKTVIEPAKLVGTKWIGWSKYISNQMTVEFVDRTNCIYTAQPKQFSLRYKIREGDLFISNIEGPFELRGNVLFNNDIPVFEKAA